MERKLFLLVILLLPIPLLVGKEYNFQDYSLRIDIPETIRFRYYTPNEENGISADSDIEIIIRIKPLGDYLHDRYAHTYLSNSLFFLLNTKETVTQETILELLSAEDSSFIMNKPTAKYDILSSYRKYSVDNEIIGESYFGMVGDGGLAPNGYHNLLILIHNEYLISISLILHDSSFNIANKYSEFFHKNSNGTLFFNDPFSENIEGFYSKLQNDEILEEVGSNNFFTIWGNLINTIRLTGEQITNIGILNDSQSATGPLSLPPMR